MIPQACPRTPKATRNIGRPTESLAAKMRTRQQEAETRIAYTYNTVANTEIGIADSDPKNLNEAMAAPDWESWDEAIHEELNQLHDMGTWKLVDLPEGREAIGSKWVFIRKCDEHGNVVHHKVRLVAQGYSQTPGIDLSETGTFAPVMRLDTLRTMLAISSVQDLDIQQLDIKGAYLNGYLKEEVYMRQPVGYEDSTGCICRLLRPLYGLKQAGNVWNKEFDGTMKELGYT